MGNLTVDRSYREAAPLNAVYTDYLPAPPFLELALSGNVRVGTPAGSAIPESVWSGRNLRWELPEQMSAEGIDMLITELLPELEELHNERWKSGDGWIHQRRDQCVARLIENIEVFCQHIDPMNYGCAAVEGGE